MGENVGIGGRGELEILRDMNSLSAFDTKGFDVKVGDLEMRFMGQAYQIPRKHTYQNSFAIDDISMTVNGRSLEGRYQIKKENERYLVDDNKRIVAGRVVGIGPLSSTAELSIDFADSDLEAIRDEVKGAWWSDKEALIGAMKEKNFRVNLDVTLPVESVSVAGVSLYEVSEKNIDQWIFNL